MGGRANCRRKEVDRTCIFCPLGVRLWKEEVDNVPFFPWMPWWTPEHARLAARVIRTSPGDVMLGVWLENWFALLRPFSKSE